METLKLAQMFVLGISLRLPNSPSNQRKDSQSQVLQHLHHPEARAQQLGRTYHGHRRHYNRTEYGDADAQQSRGEVGDNA